MKTKLLLLLVLLLSTSISSLAFQESQDYRVLFEKAKYTMETKADLQEAITLLSRSLQAIRTKKNMLPNHYCTRGYAMKSLEIRRL